MRDSNGRRMRNTASAGAALLAIAAMAGGTGLVAHAQPGATPACPSDNGGLSLSPGFCATVFADNLGHVRHLAVSATGTVYANTWSGAYYVGSPPPPGGFLIALKDTTGSGHADHATRFGPTPADGAHGGTGVQVFHNFIYAEESDRIVRYQLAPGTDVPTGRPQAVLTGMPLGGDHPMHPFIIDPKGRLFVDMGTATNACQPVPQNRKAGVAGEEPCTQTQTRGGIWLYDARILGQKFSPAERYATGLRNGEGLAFDATGRLFATQHGRDQLEQNWASLYPDAAKTVELPSEELVELTKGGDYGWPRCYYDGFQQKLVLAPEYGGDGGKAVGVCAQKQGPVAAFPAHWGPNDLAIYNAKAFPAPYQGGAFIAFHGSWNRAPAPQAGYNVVFQPMKDGKAAGDYIVFADGFAGAQRDPGHAAYRPTGFAIGPDGALYIADDVKGRIWKVTYHGPADLTQIAPASAPAPGSAPPPPAAAQAAPLPVPPGSSPEQVAAGDRLFHASGCQGCHGGDAKGTPVGPNLTSGTWLWGDGSQASISDVIAKGVPQPKSYRSPMPAMGGANLSKDDLAAVSAYVWAVGHQGK